ncbi:MAG TPA: methyl-accepting chemotaxis protein, partial [Spirochaetota bacterium]|nr:methyl-accepting chemotaxis protein [Spirochaetota bacterium]
ILERVEGTIIDIKSESDRIGDTIAMIVDIADRINMLSLNASIEAARAGEHGRGFAVVANEIGKLASQTGESVKEIENVLKISAGKTQGGVAIIKEASNNIKEMIDQMLQSSAKIDDLRDNIFLEEKFLQGIDRQMKTNVQLSRETGTGTEEQKLALETTTSAVENMSLEVARMADSINTITGAAIKISEEARSLIEMANNENITETKE